MKIVLCVKQVPDTSDIKWTEHNTIQREGVESILNPYDVYAIEAALKIKKENNAELTAITMGPAQADEILRKAISVGIDNGYLISDKKFAGADTYATGSTLSAAIKKILPDFDIIICGQFAVDGDTAQTGPTVAGMLGIPQITYVKDIEKLNGKTRAVALLNLGDTEAEFDLPLSEIDMAGTVKVRDLVNHKDEAPIKDRIKTTVPPHSIKVWKVKGKRIERTKYNAGTAFMPLFNDLGKNPEIIRYTEDKNAPCGVNVGFLGNSPQNVMKWKNVYTKKGGKYKITVSYSTAETRSLFIEVNGKRQTANSLNSGGYNIYSDVSFEAYLRPGNNIITLGNDYSWAPDIAGITLTRL